jgi:hypothetical protein
MIATSAPPELMKNRTSTPHFFAHAKKRLQILPVVAVPPLALALRAKRLSAYQNQQGISRKITNQLTGADGF